MRHFLVGLMISLSGCGLTRELAVRSFIQPLRLPVIGTPHGVYRDVLFTTDDGLTLDGWLFEPSGPPSGLVVFLHGKDANRMHFANDAERFTKRGYRVLAYDQRAHGRSQGQWCTFGAKEVPDLQRALDRFAPPGPVFLIGESMGAAVALEAAARDARISGVVAGASFSDLRTIATEHRPFFMSDADLSAALHESEARADFQVDAISPSNDARAIRAPVLLLHGSDDPFIGLDHSIRIRANLKPDDTFVTLTGVQHIDILLHDEAWRFIEHWFDTVRCATPAGAGAARVNAGHRSPGWREESPGSAGQSAG